MSTLRVSLFGRFCIECDRTTAAGFDARKVQELFSYLLLFPGRPHFRGDLANRLWDDNITANTRRYLRKSLWQLQGALDSLNSCTKARLLLVESDWIQLNAKADFWLDVAVFERAFAISQDVPGPELDQTSVRKLQNAVSLYVEDLLEGWYQDWCLYERERFQLMRLIMLDKLMNYCEAHGDYENGLSYGMDILRQDRARERTHRAMMRLYCLIGDRTSALRQYAFCASSLREELDVLPADRTSALYEQVRTDRLSLPAPAGKVAQIKSDGKTTPQVEMLEDLERQKIELSSALHRVEEKIDGIKKL
jgi:DNA-binding SARP family transcriptional activator